VWSYNSTPQYAFMACSLSKKHRYNFIFYLWLCVFVCFTQHLSTDCVYI